MVNTFCGRENHGNALPPDKAGSESGREWHCTDRADWQEGNHRENTDSTKIINSIEYWHYQLEWQNFGYTVAQKLISQTVHEKGVPKRFW